MLVDARRAESLPDGARVLDLCTGSGVLAIAAARLPAVATVTAVEGPIPTRGLARAWEGGFDGRVLIDRICDRGAQHLRRDGVVMLVHSSICGERATLDTLASRGLDATVVYRHRGPLGPIVRARVAALCERGLLDDMGSEEIVVIAGRATRSRPSHTPARPRFRAIPVG